MLAAASPASAAGVSTSDRDPTATALLRAESARGIPTSLQQGSTATNDNKDKVTLSEKGLEQAREQGKKGNENNTSTGTTDAGQQRTAKDTSSTGVQILTPAEEKVVEQFQERDRKVKAHEMAHLANAGQYARGSPSYSYLLGPDGRRYAIGGEVPIDLSTENKPEQTIQKMETIIRAAMAPADPSSADRSIAAAAAAKETRARQEIQKDQADPSRQQEEPGNESQTTKTPTVSDTTVVSKLSRPAQPLHIVA